MMMERIGPLGLEVIGVRCDGRRRYDPVSKERLIEACLRPGVSVSALALQHGLNANLVRKWIACRRQQEVVADLSAQGSSAFVRIETTLQPTASRPSAPDREVGAMCPAEVPIALSARLQASLPNGVTVSLEGCNPLLLAAMIGALGRCDVSPVA